MQLIQLHNEYPDKVRLVFRHLPLDFHDKALLSAQAAEAAGKQGKFFEMTNYLFEKQPEWAGLTPEDFAKWLPAAVKALALDEAQFNADYSSEAIVQKVKAAQEKGIAVIANRPFRQKALIRRFAGETLKLNKVAVLKDIKNE